MDISELKRNNRIEINRHPWEGARLKVIQHLLVKHKKKFNHILDIGSGDAFVIKSLHKSKLANHYTGIDTAFSDDLIDLLQGDQNVHLLAAMPANLEPGADCVLMLDVLEHCEDDYHTLQTIVNGGFIKQNAFVLITVPAFQSLYSQHDDLLGHFRRYNYKQLKKLCEKNNLIVIDGGYFFSTLLILRCLQLIQEKIKHRKIRKTVEDWKGSKWLTKTLEIFLYIDFLISRAFLRLGVRIPGLSAYSICRL